jgi:protein-S-isoprenylcysteine O-methyltransferase
MIRNILELLVLFFPISEIALSLSRRARGPSVVSPADRGSLRLLWIVFLTSVGLAAALSEYVPTRIHAVHFLIDLTALSLMVGGLILRWTSVFVLGRFFTVNVVVMEDHRVIETGPYRFVRHPSYTGLLLAFTGLGLYFRNWLSVAVILIPVTLALLYRIRIEEAALRAVMGGEYTAYCARTKRLLPGLL